MRTCDMTVAELNFNSNIVQLKETARIEQSNAIIKFQFQYSTIKSE